jgi:hypothetical protein
MTDSPSHEHYEWLAEVATEIERDYMKSRVELERRGTAATQEVGHRSESAWGRVFREWLPPTYLIGYRKYLLLETGDTLKTRETDLVVFHPSYPKSLRDRTTVLASGVAAAFSTKRTLDRAGLEEAITASHLLHRGMKKRAATLRDDVVPSVFYGLLAHSHSWKSQRSEVEKKISAILREHEVNSRPREGIDLVCIADLNCWSRITTTITHAVSQSVQTNQRVAVAPAVNTGLGHSESISEDSKEIVLPPISVLITELLGKLATNDPSSRPIADGLRVTGTSGSGRADMISWPLHEVLDPCVQQHLDSRWDTDEDWRGVYS